MEFLLFLTAKEKEILDLIYKAKFSIEENTPLCLLGDSFFGFFKKEKRTIVICTENAKRIGGYYIPKPFKDNDNDATGRIVRRALRHESVHAAQMCNKGNVIIENGKKKLFVHPYKRKSLETSIALSPESKKREYEAYSIEDKANIIIAGLKKYCL